MELTDERRRQILNDTRARLGLPPIESGGRDPRAVAKLSINEQCEILAFTLCGVPANLVAIAFDVHHRTVRRLKHPDTKKYPRVMAELMLCDNNVEFCNKFITEKMETSIREIYPEFRRLSQ